MSGTDERVANELVDGARISWLFRPHYHVRRVIGAANVCNGWNVDIPTMKHPTGTMANIAGLAGGYRFA